MSPETTVEAGRRAEQRALGHLESCGLQLLERNFRCRGGEIDLVMLDGETLVLVEVRSRANDAFGGAAASVGARKRQRLLIAARRLLLVRPRYRALRARFDVVAFDGDGSEREIRVDWIRDAFRL